MTTTEDTTTTTKVKPQHSEATWRHMLSRYPDAMAAWLLGVTEWEVSEWRDVLAVGYTDSGAMNRLDNGARLWNIQWDAWAWDLTDRGALVPDTVKIMDEARMAVDAPEWVAAHLLRWPGLDADADDIACYDDVPASVGAGMLPAGLPEE